MQSLTSANEEIIFLCLENMKNGTKMAPLLGLAQVNSCLYKGWGDDLV